MNWFENQIKKWEKDDYFLFQEVIIDIAEKILEYMKKHNISREEVEKKIGNKIVHRVLNGVDNLKLFEIVKFCNSINLNIKFILLDK